MSRPGSARTPRSGLLVDPEAAEQQRPTTSAANASRSMVPAGTDALGSQALRAKNARIRAEQDRQLLQNRINRLIIEEEKAAKRISETRRRAKEIWDLKRRNEANQAARADAGSWMSSEQHLQRQLLTQARGERTTALDSSKAALAHMRKEEVSVLRQMRRENEEAVVAQRNMEHARCVARKQSVKQHQNDAAQRRNKVREAALEVQPQSRPRSQPHRNPNARTDPHAHPHPTPFSLASTLALAPALANANTPHSLPHPRPRPCPLPTPIVSPPTLALALALSRSASWRSGSCRSSGRMRAMCWTTTRGRRCAITRTSPARSSDCSTRSRHARRSSTGHTRSSSRWWSGLPPRPNSYHRSSPAIPVLLPRIEGAG